LAFLKAGSRPGTLTRATRNSRATIKSIKTASAAPDLPEGKWAKDVTAGLAGVSATRDQLRERRRGISALRLWKLQVNLR
jgi:hypothetical protein